MKKTFFSIGILVVSALTAQSAFSQCLPFFDNDNSTRVTNVVTNYMSHTKVKQAIDMSPKPLAMNDLDKDILSVCGDWGKSVSDQDLDWLIGRHPELVAPFKNQLTSLGGTPAAVMRGLWGNHKAFEHIFCGQPKSSKIGGLHFWARYYDLQQKGQICMMDNNLGNEEVLPGKVYTLGVTSARGDDSLKGYSLTQSAYDIFYQGTAGYFNECVSSSRKAGKNNNHGKPKGKGARNNYEACLSPYYKDRSFVLQYVCNPGEGIVTMYPYAGMNQGKMCTDIPAPTRRPR